MDPATDAALHKAIPLAEREALVANACAFADTAADPTAMWMCQGMVKDIQLELLQFADQASKKRTAGASAGSQPPAKRAATQAAAVAWPAAAAAATQQPPAAQYYQQPGYDYSGYYQQQQQYAGYYPGYYQ